MKKQLCHTLITIALLALTGCAAKAGHTALPSRADGGGSVEDPVREPARDGQNASGNGSMIVGDLGNMEQGQQDVIFSYMDRYYETVASLKTAELSDLFEVSAEADRIMNQAAWEYLTGLRAFPGEELKLDNFQYELTLLETQTEDDGSVRLRFSENNVQRFARHPEIDTEIYNVIHTFVLTPAGSSWKIRSHWQEDGVYQNIMGEYRDVAPDQIPEPEAYFTGQKEHLLSQAEEQLFNRKQEYGGVHKPWVHHAYNREEAVAYAEQWIGARNGIWADFTGKGGNCQNFVSQCLFAAGIPRDISGEWVWSWTMAGSHMREDEVTSNAWINVAEFRRYAAENRGYGLAAVTEAPFMEGEPGDVIQMGFPGIWNHAVLIGSVVRDAEGRTIDYLIHSNTSDVKNFPVSAYPIPCQSLTKICGWRSR